MDELKQNIKRAIEIVKELSPPEDLKGIVFTEVLSELRISRSQTKTLLKEESGEPILEDFFINISRRLGVSQGVVRRVFDYSNEDFELILYPLPGDRVVDKERAAAKLVLIGFQYGLGMEMAPAIQLKEKLRKVGLGTSNLSKYLKGLGREVVTDGKKSKLAYRLTLGGEEWVKRQLKNIENEQGSPEHKG